MPAAPSLAYRRRSVTQPSRRARANPANLAVPWQHLFETGLTKFCNYHVVTYGSYGLHTNTRLKGFAHASTHAAFHLPHGPPAAPADRSVDDLHPLGPAQQRSDPVWRTETPRTRRVGQDADRTAAHAGRGARRLSPLRADDSPAGDLWPGQARRGAARGAG